MSLLNDALKRAQEAQSPNTLPGVAPLRSVGPPRQESSFFGRLLMVLIVLAVLAAFVFGGLAMTGRLAKKTIVAQPAVPAKPDRPLDTPEPAVAAVPVAPEAAAVEPKPVATPAPMVTVSPTPAVAPASTPVVVAATPAPAPARLELPDTLHVQGIAFGSDRPWAIVSGRTAYVGDRVKGFEILAITRDSVTFGSNGLSNVLYVGQ